MKGDGGGSGHGAHGSGPGSRGVHDHVGLEKPLVGGDALHPPAAYPHFLHRDAVPDRGAAVLGHLEIAGQQGVDVDDAVRSAPHGSVEPGVLEQRHGSAGLLRRPALHRETPPARQLHVVAQRVPLLPASEDQGADGVVGNRHGPVRRGIADEPGRFRGQIGHGRLGQHLAYETGIPARGMEPGHRFLLHDDHLPRALESQVTGGGGARESGAYDDVSCLFGSHVRVRGPTLGTESFGSRSTVLRGFAGPHRGYPRRRPGDG